MPCKFAKACQLHDKKINYRQRNDTLRNFTRFTKNGSLKAWHLQNHPELQFFYFFLLQLESFINNASDYAELKIAELMLGETEGIIQPTYHMERGQSMEVEARDAYEFTHDVTVKRGGFITDDNGHYGCSPDFLVDEDGCGEIKCLMGKTM